MTLPPFIKALVPASIRKSFASDFLRGIDLEGIGSVGGLTEPFRQSVWVQRALKKVAGPICSVPLLFSSSMRGGTPLNDPALLAFWQAPARTEGGVMALSDFVEASVSWLKLSGEFFWLIPEEWFTSRFAKERPPLIMARPDRMRHVVQGGILLGWVFTDAAGRQIPLPTEQVIQQKLFNPYCEFRGLSEYESARIATEGDYMSGKFTLNLARNNGNRGEYVISKSGIPTAEQRDHMVSVLMEKRRKAMRGEFAPAFLSGDISIQEPGVQSPDANFVAQRLQNRHEIFLAFGVPPSMADIQASYSVGSASDRYVLIEETCVPTSNKVAEKIEEVSRLFSSGRKPVFAHFDFSQHSVMQAARRESVAAGVLLVDRGMPWKQANEWLGLGLPQFTGWDRGHLPFNVQPIEDLSKPPVADVPPPAKHFELMVKALHNNDAVEKMTRALQGENLLLQQRGGERKAERVKLWEAHMRQRKAAIAAYESKFNATLMVARKQTLQQITANYQKAIVSRSALDLIFDLDSFTLLLGEAMKKAGRNALDIATQQIAIELGLDDPLTMPGEEVLGYLFERENKITGCAQTVFDAVITQLDEGISEGETTDELTARVKTTFNDLSKAEARRIAMTETSAAYGLARQSSMERAGITHKQWLTSGLDNVRPGHLAAEEQIVGIDETFTVAGEQLAHPGDSAGSAGNVINCHCVSIAVKAPKAS